MGITVYEKSGFYDVWFRLKGIEGVDHHILQEKIVSGILWLREY